MAMMGYMHYSGQGREQDFQAALLWTIKAAERGEANAMLTYGVMFAEGKALTRDMVQAYKWFLLAEKHAGLSKRGLILRV